MDRTSDRGTRERAPRQRPGAGVSLASNRTSAKLEQSPNGNANVLYSVCMTPATEKLTSRSVYQATDTVPWATLFAIIGGEHV